MIGWKQAAVLSLAVLAAGCSSNSKKELPPAELTKFTEEVVLKKQWSRSIGDGQGETYNTLVPAIENDRIYASDVNGEVFALDRITGDVAWKKDLELPVSGAVGVGYGLVMLGTLKGEVIALDSSTGEERWRSRVTSEVLAPPANNGDVVVVQTQDDRLIGLDAATGDRRWIYENTPAVLTLRGTGAPIATNRLAVAGLSTGKVVAVDINNGVPVWESRVAIPQGRSELDRVVDIDGGLLLSGGTLYVSTYQAASRAWTWKAAAWSGSVMLPATWVSPRATATSTSAKPRVLSRASTSALPAPCGPTTRWPAASCRHRKCFPATWLSVTSRVTCTC